MYFRRAVYGILLFMLTSVIGRRDLFNTKCTRQCNTAEGSLECWTKTTDGFSYGLATSMIDFCQVILKVRELTDETNSWYTVARDLLKEQIEKYEIGGARQLSSEAVEEVAISLLDKCYNASSTIISSEPPCPSCTTEQNRLVKQWQLSSIVIYSVGLGLVLITLILYSLHSYHIRRSYASI
ncbi:unnamed protein product [Adineta ricciae]|uniref:Uncharacterized protein n=1 Tax=Adineta ricciae TaxID=249248 RepID=A0A815REP0_ADIRI|nr:unnamed protein product [Adineta ricciae]